MEFRSLKIVSGGQTGVDRGALDAALEAGIPCGGWCPKGRLAEDGPIDERYPLIEMDSARYIDRTRQNVIDSDGTLIIHFGPLEGGSARTRDYCKQHDKPCLVLDAKSKGQTDMVNAIVDFIEQHDIETLNVAGPRASKEPTARSVTESLLFDAIRQLGSEADDDASIEGCR
jgi:hypothetical protein